MSKNLSQRITTFASEFSDALIGVILACIGVVSAIPEFVGTYHVSNSLWLAIAVSATGVGSVHVGLRNKSWLMAGVFVVHFIALQIYFFASGATGDKMLLPVFTAIGAAVMSQATLHVQERATDEERQQRMAEDERQNRLAEAEHKRQLDLIDAQAKADAKRIKAEVSTGVKTTVNQGVNPLSTTVNPLSIDERRKRILTAVQSSGRVSLSDLMTLTGVSINTVKRDVDSQPGIELTGDGHASITIHTNGVHA